MYTKEEIAETLDAVPAPLLIQRRADVPSSDFIDHAIKIDMAKAENPVVTLMIYLKRALREHSVIVLDARQIFNPQIIAQMVDIADHFDYSKILVVVSRANVGNINRRLADMVAVEYKPTAK